MRDWNKENSTRVATAIVAFIFSLLPLTLLWFVSMAGEVSFKWVVVLSFIFGIWGFISPDKFPRVIEDLWKGLFGHRE